MGSFINDVMQKGGKGDSIYFEWVWIIFLKLYYVYAKLVKEFVSNIERAKS